MKRKILLILAVFFTMLLTACGEKESEEPDLRELVYHSEELSCMDRIKGEITNYTVRGDRIYFCSSEWRDPSDEDRMETQQYFYMCNTDGSQLLEIPYKFSYSEDEWLYSMIASPKGELCLIYSRYSDESMENTYILRVLNTDGDVLGQTDLTDAVKTGDIYATDVKMDKNGYLYLYSDRTLCVADTEGNLLGQLEAEDRIENLVETKDGDILAGFDLSQGYTLKKIDADDELSWGKTYVTQLPYHSISCFCPGDEYDFYYNTEDALYAYCLESGAGKEAVNWMASNVNSRLLGDVKVLGRDKILGIYGEEDDGEEGDAEAYGLYLFEKADPKDVPVKERVVYASLYPDEGVKAQAIRFNRSQDKYLVEVKNYSYSEDPVAALHEDLMSGQAGDILDLSFISADKYIKKGFFVDLYKFMEQDSDMEKEDFSRNILSVMETDSCLYHIAPAYGVNVIASRASDVAPGKAFASYAELEKAEKDGVKAFAQETKASMLSRELEMNYDRYVDWNTGTAQFESSEFIDALRYANTYPAVRETDLSEETDASLEEPLCIPVYSMTMEDIGRCAEIFGGEAAFGGYVSEEFPGGAMSPDRDLVITEFSSCKDGAWEFLKTFLTREYFYETYGEEKTSVPVRRDATEDMIRRYMEEDTVTEEQTGLFEDVIAGIDHRYMYDSDIDAIVLEEADPYFNGQIPAEEAAFEIQTRVMEYMKKYE